MLPDFTQAPLHVWLAAMTLPVGVFLLAYYYQKKVEDLREEASSRDDKLEFWDKISIYEASLVIVALFVLNRNLVSGELYLGFGLLFLSATGAFITALSVGLKRLYRG